MGPQEDGRSRFRSGVGVQERGSWASRKPFMHAAISIYADAVDIRALLSQERISQTGCYHRLLALVLAPDDICRRGEEI